MRNIKAIKAELSTLREEYEAKVAALEAEMAAVRTARGYVKKVPAYEAKVAAKAAEMAAARTARGYF